MNTNFKVIGLTLLEIKLESTAPEADAFITRPSELLYQGRVRSFLGREMLRTKNCLSCSVLPLEVPKY